MRYRSTNKTHVGDSQVRNTAVEALSRASVAAATPPSLGDGSASSSLSPDENLSYKDNRFRD